MSQGSRSSTLLFRYTVADGDNDSDGIGMATSIISNGGGIQDLASNDAQMELIMPADLSSVIVDTIPPRIINADIPYGNYNSEKNIDITVTFDEIVQVGTGTSAQIELEIGSDTQYADYLLGSGSSILVFRYSVIVGNNDSDGVEIAEEIRLNNGSIKDQAGNNAILDIITPNNLGMVLVNTGVDTIPPSITSVSIPNGNYLTDDNIDFAVEFNENIAVNTDSGIPYLVLVIGASTKHAIYHSNSGGRTLIFRYQVVNSDEDLDGITVATPLILNEGIIEDSANNNSSLDFVVPENLKYVRVNDVVDIVSPTITK